MTLPVLNVSAYRFAELDELHARRQHLFDIASAADLKGTVLLAEEGINLVLAGEAGGVQAFLDALRSDPPFSGLKAKESWSDVLPFKRLKVKVKREIIRMNMPSIRPSLARAPSVAPATLARWLATGRDDAGRPVVTLDTRNDFEVDAGAFEGALDWRLHRFSDFPEALATHRDELQGKTVVSYCTGGIRCEKAALLMQAMGLDHAYQLEGGILKYFEETEGAPHWRGGCFVFDEREQLASDLAPTA